jgi:hypothetical protein
MVYAALAAAGGGFFTGLFLGSQNLPSYEKDYVDDQYGGPK